ncbi:MAG: hypothetical protein LBC82_05795 [Oscillospiraceae bacterium]|jgi:hypothetical protein|nr:hypothetical protein [Oscillospiraceae bacterium]
MNAVGKFNDILNMNPQELSNLSVPLSFVSRTLDSCRYHSYNSGREDEREEFVCRLLANGMSHEEICVVMKIRIEEIRIIESNNAAIKIPDYVKKLKARRKSREKQNNNTFKM